jgi:hypothetical protein
MFPARYEHDFYILHMRSLCLKVMKGDDIKQS